MTNKDEAKIVEKFRDITVNRLNDVMVALPALVPQSEEDKALFKRGMNALNNLIYDLKHAETTRAIGEFLDIPKILRDFDEDSINTLDSQINSSARASIEQIASIADRINEDN